jgi:hypothetical protein
MKPTSNTRTLIQSALLGMLTLSVAHADSGRKMPRNTPQAYTAECAACHMAYPPALLPAASWQRIMSGLDKHYGTDASLDAATVKDLGTWLQANAGSSRRFAEAPPEDRITRSAWFVRKHHEVNPAIWRHASVKSAANCAACHIGAEKGNFDEDSVRLPADLRSRRSLGLRLFDDE